jgi:hypothetical protein
MNSLPRLVLYALTAAVLFFAVGSGLASRLGRPDVVEALRGILTEVRRAEELNAREEVSFRSFRGKQAVTRELVAGRLTLAEAVEQFRDLTRAHEGAMKELLAAYPTSTEDEAVCQSLLTWVRTETRRDPCRRAALLARLEAEMRQHLCHPGGPAL